MFKLQLQRLGGLSYFAGAEKKDERVLVPDLGSLTSVYDRSLLFPNSLFKLRFNFPVLAFAFVGGVCKPTNLIGRSA